LRQYFSRLPSAEQKVAEFILQHPTRALNASVEELAATCGTSPSTVVRLAKDVGFDGMKSMRLALAQEVGTLMPRMFEGTAAPAGGDYLTELLENTILGLRETAAAFDYPSLQRAVDAIMKANRTDVCGAGSSYLVGLDLV